MIAKDNLAFISINKTVIILYYNKHNKESVKKKIAFVISLAGKSLRAGGQGVSAEPFGIQPAGKLAPFDLDPGAVRIHVERIHESFLLVYRTDNFGILGRRLPQFHFLAPIVAKPRAYH